MVRARRSAWGALLLLLSCIALALGLTGRAYAQQPHALLISVEGPINRVTEDLISRALDKAETEGAEVLITDLIHREASLSPPGRSVESC